MTTFGKFCSRLLTLEANKNEQALAFLWFYLRSNDEKEGSFDDISGLFELASLPSLRRERFKEFARKSRRVYRGSRQDYYRLAPDAVAEYDAAYGDVFETPAIPPITERARLSDAPLLTQSDIDDARSMAELYIILHCYENSARKLIEKVLSGSLGANWWDVAANSQMKRKFQDRQQKEITNKWLTPRGASPLFYMDWGDLLSLIRKYEADFLPFIGDIKFIELRMEELERSRNIIAHNGVLTAEDDHQRIVLSFKEWCRQVNP